MLCLLFIFNVSVWAEDEKTFPPPLIHPTTGRADLVELIGERAITVLDRIQKGERCPPGSTICTCGWGANGFPLSERHSLGEHVGKLSVVTEEEADFLFEMLKNQAHVPFKYPWDGCYARATHMSLLMERMGVISGKIWVGGGLKVQTRVGEVNWKYHVASVILVKGSDGQVRPMVMDPSLFSRPVSPGKWTEKQNAKDLPVYTNRFPYWPDKGGKIPADRTNWELQDIEHAQYTMNFYRKKLDNKDNTPPTTWESIKFDWGF